ncbi:MAG: hypothetical protein ABH878_06400, partial [bacterium]
MKKGLQKIKPRSPLFWGVPISNILMLPNSAPQCDFYAVDSCLISWKSPCYRRFIREFFSPIKPDATDESGNWVYAIIDPVDIGWTTSIEVDSNNKVHISYNDTQKDDLKYATNTSGTWSVLTLDSEGELDDAVSIAIDSNNEAHISYYDD